MSCVRKHTGLLRKHGAFYGLLLPSNLTSRFKFGYGLLRGGKKGKKSVLNDAEKEKKEVRKESDNNVRFSGSLFILSVHSYTSCYMGVFPRHHISVGRPLGLLSVMKVTP